MRNAAIIGGLACLLAWAYVCGQPCVAQAPDWGPPAPVATVAEPARLRPDTQAWGPEQATGAPDTETAGDIPTAWASLNPDGGVEWLRVDFDQAVTVSEVRIRESFNPGAVSKVAAILEDGKEHVLWEGFDLTADAPADFTVLAEGDVVSKSLKIYLDTTRIAGWNEIDAVALVGKNGTRQWASRASASSTYAVRTAAIAPAQQALDPFADVYGKRVIGHLEGDKSVSGTFVRAVGGFIVLEGPDADKIIIVNVQKMLYLETAEQA